MQPNRVQAAPLLVHLHVLHSFFQLNDFMHRKPSFSTGNEHKTVFLELPCCMHHITHVT